MGGGGRPRGHPHRPQLHQLPGRARLALQRRRPDLRAGRRQPQPPPRPHRRPTDPGRPRRDPPRRGRPELGRGHPRGLHPGPPPPGPDRHPLPLRRRPHPLRALRRRGRRDQALPGRLLLRLRRRPARRRRAPRHVPELLRADALAHPHRRGGRRPPGRAADQGHAGPGLAHRPGPGGGVDPRGAGRRRPAPDRGPPPDARRRGPRHRLRPGPGPRLRGPAADHHRRGAHGRPVRRHRRLQPHRGLRRLHGPLDGGRAHGLRGRRRAPPRRRRLRHLDLHAAVLRPGGRPFRALARQGRDRQRLPALGDPAAGAGGRAGGRPRPRPGPAPLRGGPPVLRPRGPAHRRGQ